MQWFFNVFYLKGLSRKTVMKFRVTEKRKNNIVSFNGLLPDIIHEFELDGDEHDDEAIEKLHIDFKNDFDIAATALSQQYGPPVKSGTDDDDALPLTGIMHFSIWRTDDAGLFLAISHEDRGTPILLMLGCTSE